MYAHKLAANRKSFTVSVRLLPFLFMQFAYSKHCTVFLLILYRSDVIIVKIQLPCHSTHHQTRQTNVALELCIAKPLCKNYKNGCSEYCDINAAALCGGP